ncbi:MAG: DUF4062 domain-containing protein [Eubacterium sp.]|nr:DUF4062 domain-containing protein [Eubacterium sp.]
MDKRYQVFVSSTYDDLKEERIEAIQAILECDCFPAGMELFHASDDAQWNIIKRIIDDSDFFLLIIAGRYGSLVTNNTSQKISYTEKEFDYAQSKGIPVIALIHDSPEDIPVKHSETTSINKKKLEKFRIKVRIKEDKTRRMVAFWNNKDKLKSIIITSLHQAIKDNSETAVGWIRANAKVSTNNTSSLSGRFYKDEIALLKEKIISLQTPDEIIEFLEQLGSIWYRDNCFQDNEFIKKFAGFISLTQPENIILGAIKCIPTNLPNSARIQLQNLINLKSIFNTYCCNTNLSNTELYYSIIQLLEALHIHSKEYVDYALNIYKTGNLSSYQKYICLKYLKDSNINYIGHDLEMYVHNEFKNPDRTLPAEDLIALLSLIRQYDGDQIFTIIYNIFKNSDMQVQKGIVRGLFKHIGVDYNIHTPKAQRLFIEICDIVYAWNDDQISTDLLLYCLFCRTRDVFTSDEIFSKLCEFNDDVFYMFISELSYDEYSKGAESWYDISREEIIDLIKRRKHPKEKNLLQKFEDII